MPAPEAAAAPPPPAIPPAAILPDAPPLPADADPAAPPGPDEGPARLVERRVVSTEVRSRHYDEPGDGPAEVGLLEALPQPMTEGVSFPLTYRLAVSSGHSGVTLRQADSAPARAALYACYPFYKPISRCMGGRG
jgi:hypothetical protein